MLEIREACDDIYFTLCTTGDPVTRRRSPTVLDIGLGLQHLLPCDHSYHKRKTRIWKSCKHEERTTNNTGYTFGFCDKTRYRVLISPRQLHRTHKFRQLLEAPTSLTRHLLSRARAMKKFMHPPLQVAYQENAGVLADSGGGACCSAVRINLI